jgi:hypothetical protein
MFIVSHLIIALTLLLAMLDDVLIDFFGVSQ